MNANQARQLRSSGQLSQFENVDLHERDGRLVVNDRVALRVRCDSSMPRESDLEVVAEDKALIGVLSFTSIDKADNESRSDFALAAYLTELDLAEFTLGRPLQHDYLVVEKDCLTEYLQSYAPSSAIWGGFVHLHETGVREKRKTSIIEASGRLRFPMVASELLCERAILAAHPFERFLKHYHQLELLVDWYVARKIARLPSDLNGFDKIMSSYGAGDLVRVRELILAFCTNKHAVRQKMNGVNAFIATAEKIFQEFGKAGNPLSKPSQWEQWKAGTLSESDVLSTAAYWIFRVRCSIAHHRVGEYLIKETDEDFVLSFAEPLLLELVSQVLSNDKLHDLV